MSIALLAIGTALPPFRRSQEEIAEVLAQGFHLSKAHKKIVKAIHKASGIETRHSVLSDYLKTPGNFEFFPNTPEGAFPTTARRMKIYKEEALKLAQAACEASLAELPYLERSQLTHLITVSCTGMYAPGLDIELVRELGLCSSIKRTAINFMGCYGAFNALKVADSICRADPKATVLIVCVELCSIHFQNKGKLDNLISNAIFSDGAAAAILQAEVKGREQYFSLEHFYCDLLPQTSQEMAWEIADSGFDIVLSSYVPQAIHSGIATFVERLLESAQITRAELAYFAIHPGGLKILEACEAALGLTKEQNAVAYQVLRDYGNMSSATILFVLKGLWEKLKHDKTANGKKIFSCAFGPGLTLESMILKL